MDLYKYLCFILLTTVCYIDARYNLTEGIYTWSQATNVCTLATPSLNYNENGITPDIDRSHETDVWLGYIETMTPFEYFGCAKKGDLVNKDKSADYVIGDPGKCWSACNGSESIAVYRNACYCLYKNIKIDKRLNNNCNINCTSQPNIVCGGDDGNNEYASLYKTTYTERIKASESDNEICLWYDKSNNAFFWGQCTTKYRMICYRGKEIWVYNDSDKYDDWKTMTTRCLKDDGIPSTYIKTNNSDITGKDPKWTGIIRNGVIYQVKNTTNVTEGKYGYVNILTKQLSFTTNKTVRKRALCVEGTIVEAEITTSTGSSDVGAIVGASLAIIIVIIVVVVLVVLWKRGMKFPFKKARQLERENTQATNMTYNFVRPDNTIQGTAESSFNNYAEVDVSKMTPGTGVTQNGDANRTSDSSNETHPYIVLEKGNEGTYDTTKTTPQIHDQHTFNPYNEISLEESSNYDHIGAHVNDSKTLGLGNPYNSTTLASSNKYNGLKNNAFNRNDDSDDTYNHIDGQLLQTELNQSDNPYNTTALGQYRDHNLQNDYGGTNIAFNSNDECDDTYNHIGDQPGQND